MVDSYQKISAMAFKMQKNEKIYPENTQVSVILNDINPKIIVNNELKIYTFNEIFVYSKRKIIDTKLLKSTSDIYNDPMLVKVGTSISPDLLSQISKIKSETIRKGQPFMHKEKNKI